MSIEDEGSNSFLVFEPEQIKSATRNNGEYSSNPDVYKQIIGKKGADGEWRTEILDGNIRRQAFSDYPKRKRFTLRDIYDNDELFTAYPEPRNMPVHVERINNAELGYYDSLDKNIALNQTKLKIALKNQDYYYIASCLIHEIQHAVQDLEGFDGGSGLDLSDRHALKHFNRLMMPQPPNVQDKMRLAADSLYKNNDKSQFEAAIASMSAQEREVWEQLTEQYNRLEAAYDRYRRSTGEVEARNTQTRTKWDKAQRCSTILTKSEDKPRSKQIRTPR